MRDNVAVIGGHYDSQSEFEVLRLKFRKSPNGSAVNTILGGVQVGVDLTQKCENTQFCQFDSDKLIDGWYLLRGFIAEASRLSAFYPYLIELFYLGDVTEINDCDATTDWSGTSLSQETADKFEGTASVKDTISTPTIDTEYDSTYNPTGSWGWSDVERIGLFLKSDRASSVFTFCRLVLVDTAAKERYWNITFNAEEWTHIKRQLSSFDGEDSGFDPSIVDKVIIRFKTADTTAFYKLIDYVIT